MVHASQFHSGGSRAPQAEEELVRPWLRRIEVTLGPLEEWRGNQAGEILRFASDGSPDSLKVTGNFTRAIMGMPNPSRITVHNLARDTRSAIRTGLTRITVDVGWKNTGLHRLFQGSILSVMSQRSGQDIVTSIQAIPGYGAMLRGISTKSYASGMPVRDAVRDLAADLPGVSVPESGIQGITGRIGSGGWSFGGNTREALTQLAHEHGFSWSVDNGEFRAIGDKATFGGFLELNGRDGGLMEVSPVLSGPSQKQTGVRIKAVYVPGVTAGSAVRVNSQSFPEVNGTYRVNTCTVSVDAFSDQWIMDLETLQTVS